MRTYILKTLAILALGASTAPGLRAAGPNVNDIKTSITDDAIVFPESFEQDTRKLLEGWYMRNYTATDDSYAGKKDPATSDEEIKKRLAAMPTLIEMPFNPVVRQYIDRYTQKGRAQLAAILGLSLYYMPIFEQALEEKGLPQELKYLPVVESALDPNAVSKHGAAGLWQLMLATGKGLGLDCNSLVDERRDPYASSKAAAELLKQLFDTYGDWSLTIAAYNSGPNAVNKAIRRSGIDPTKADFWNIYPYLTEETRGYVPMFIAANYVMTYHPLHNINPVLPTRPLVTDTVGVTDRMHFDQISTVLGIPADELRLLNPQYREDIIPGSPERAYMLTLPQGQVASFLMSRDQILAYNAAKYSVRTSVELAQAAEEREPGQTSPTGQTAPTSQTSQTGPTGPTSPTIPAAPTTISHKVASGETLNTIAQKYGVQAADIRTANNLRRNAVRVGQVLTIANVAPEFAAAAAAAEPLLAAAEAPEATAAPAANAAPASNTAKAPAKTSKTSKAKQTAAASSKKQKARASQPTTHTIKKGDNLGALARKYGTTVDAIKKANGMKNDNITAGKTLKIPKK